MNTLVAGAATGLLLASFLVTFFCIVVRNVPQQKPVRYFFIGK